MVSFVYSLILLWAVLSVGAFAAVMLSEHHRRARLPVPVLRVPRRNHLESAA